MDSQRYLEAQTRLVDLFLPELDHAALPNLDVNFNNTRQFDALLRFLELSLQVSTFVVVPSTNVLQILITLACRCPSSNWSHRLSSLEGIPASTEYMKQVNADYDHTLYKQLVLDRSRLILKKYVQLVAEDKLAAAAGLDAHLMKAMLSLLPTSFMSFFSPKKAEQSNGEVDKMKKSMKNEPQGPASRVDLAGLPKQAVVELISDSEDSDNILEMEQPDEVASKYRQFSLPLRSITSLSDLGSKTSGLGDTTLLFKNMPHLLATATPEPEEASKPNVKRSRAPANPVDTIHVYDEPLLAKKLQSPENFDIWNLIRWTFDCADSASQYQKFLFNSSNANVHYIYITYEGFFEVFFDFLTVEYIGSENRSARHLIDRLLALLGPKMYWYDRAVEYVFTGLGISTNARCYPCYDRERLLIKYDPAILVSRCKRLVQFTDNHQSMKLRWHIICLLYFYGHSQSSSVEELMENLSTKLEVIELEYLEAFFRCFNKRISRIPQEILRELECALAIRLLNKITNVNFHGWVQGKEVATNIKNVCETLASERVFSSISEDLSYKTFSEFKDKWTKVEYLVSWMLNNMLMEVPDNHLQIEGQRILKAAAQAEHNSSHFYNEFLDSRAEDADVRAEDINFELTGLEVSSYKRDHKPRFLRVAQLVLRRIERHVFVS